MTKEDFLKDAHGYGSHRPALWEALELTRDLKLPVLELGCGDGSTPYLQKYCKERHIELHSYDFNFEWAQKYGAIYINDWANLPWRKEYAVALVDHSPGEHRKEAILLLENAFIIVVHDSEPPGWNASDYQVRPLFKNFEYKKDFQPEVKGQPWTTMLSNTIEL